MFRKFFVGVLAVVYCALAHAQGAYVGPRAYDPNAPKHTVSGTVVNTVSGEPIPRALVQIMGAQQQADFTDSQGAFRFEGVPEGRAMFIVRKPGFFGSEQMSRGGGRPRSPVMVNADISSLVLKLTPEGVVTGTITGDDGEPLEGIVISLKRQIVVNGRKQWDTLPQARTDENGEFRAAGLPGMYFLVAKAVRTASRRATLENVDYPPTYYPGAPDLASASAIEVRGGQSVQVDLRLRAQRVHEITGVITGAPADRGLNLQFTNRSGDDVASDVRYDSNDGSFKAKTAASTFTVRAVVFQPGRGTLAASTTLTVAADLRGVRLALQPAASIPVVIKTEFSKQPSSSTPAGGIVSASAKAISPSRYASVELIRLDSQQPRSLNAGWMNDDPSLTVGDVEPGRYRVEIHPRGPWYVQSATHEQTDLLREELVVGQGGEQRPIDIVLRDDGGSVTGTVVTDNNPVAAIVLVVPERRSTIPQTQYTSERGFTLNTLAPGDYMLLAFDSTDGLEYMNRDALEPYLARATHVTVNSSGSANVTLNLIKRGEP